MNLFFPIRELYSNNISGPIPSDLGNLTNLVSLDLYLNSFTGRIPDTLGKLSKLRFLYENSTFTSFIGYSCWFTSAYSGFNFLSWIYLYGRRHACFAVGKASSDAVFHDLGVGFRANLMSGIKSFILNL